jgi:hypothetical protein
MKTKIAYLFISILIISCKGSITNIKIIPTENNKNYKFYMLKYSERPDSDFIQHNCSWIEDPSNTVFVFMPVSFKLQNNTGQNLRIGVIRDNFNLDPYHPMIINDKFYDYEHGRVLINSGDEANITMFLHLPIPIKSLEKSYYDRLFPIVNNHKQDSIVINSFNSELQKAIAITIKKKDITISYSIDKNVKEKGLAIYCVDKKHLAVFRSDSLAKVNPSFKYNCD